VKTEEERFETAHRVVFSADSRLLVYKCRLGVKQVAARKKVWVKPKSRKSSTKR
jgi:hypothetical protein